jgi:NADH-quinone oxidoreductase subunit N
MLSYTVLVKLFVFLAMLSFLSQFWFISDLFSAIFLVSSIGSLAVSSIAAITEQNIRRFLSLSYLNSLGYILLAVSSGLSFGFGALTFYPAELYLASYLLAWLIIYLIFFYGVSLLANPDRFIFFSDLAKLSSNNRKNFTSTIAQIGLVVAFVSLLGLPPTAGFYAKSVLYLSVISSDISTLTLTIVLILAPVMSMSYIRLVAVMLFPQPSKQTYSTLNRLELCVYERDLSLLVEENSVLKFITYIIAAVILVLIVPIPQIVSLVV